MIWYLLICAGFGTSASCEQPTVMPSKEACIFVQKNYREATRRYVFTRCVGVRKA